MSDVLSEEWKSHPVFTDYQCHASGQVRISPERKGRGLRTVTAGQVLTPLERNGLLFARLRHEAERRDYSLAQLILETFGLEKPAPDATIRHLDNDPFNCRVENLQWSQEPAGLPPSLLEPGELAAPLAEAPGYYVTGHGRFYSLSSRRWLRYHIAQGRPTVLLMVEGREIRRAAALLVALHFPEVCGVMPDGVNTRVLQKDNDPLNCRADNLQWGSHRELLQRRAKGRQELMQQNQDPVERKILSRRPPAPPAEEQALSISYTMGWLLKQGRNTLPASDPTTGNVFYYLDRVFHPLCAECAASRVRECLAAGKSSDAMPIEQLILWPAKPHLGWEAHTIDCADCERRLEPGAAKPDLT